jgi:lipoprotein-releasing system permease protein
MFLCFFALSTNMTANLYEQSKEIAVMRSIGFTKRRVKLLYFYEAFVLVFVSCLLGMMIGVGIGYTMKLQ